MPLPSGKLMASEETQANVSTRVSKAMEDLALKGQLQQMEKEQKLQEKLLKEQERKEEEELERIRVARIERMKRDKKMEEKRVGHGEVTTITQDEFLPTVLGSARCVVHFFHTTFERCAIVDARIKTLAPQHPECRFVRIDSEKCPFFVEKLNVKVLPTLVCFEDGKSIGRKIGYNGDTEIDSLRDIEQALVEAGVLEEVKCFPEDSGPRNNHNELDEDLENVSKSKIKRVIRKEADDW